MQLSNRDLEDYLLFGNTLLTNTLNHPAIRERILEYGYNDERFEQGTALKVKAEESLQLYIAKRQEKLAMHSLVRKKFNSVFAEYIGHIKRLRKEFPEDLEMIKKLVLIGERARTYSGFIVMATNFYETAMKDTVVFSRIEGLGLTQERLSKGLTGVEEFTSLKAAYDKVKGEWQNLSQERDKDFKAFRKWISSLITTCQVAFPGRSQILEEAGIFVRNKPPSRKKKEAGTGSEDENENEDEDENEDEVEKEKEKGKGKGV